MECRYSLALIKGVRISAFSSYTGTKQTGTLNLRHIVKVQLLPGIHRRETNWMFERKATTMLRTGTTESTCTPHKLTIYFFFKEMGTRTNSCLAIDACQHDLI